MNKKLLFYLIVTFSLISIHVNIVYATTIFQDGFESGDFSAWTGTYGSPTIVSSPTHHGAYAARFGSPMMYCYKTFTETNPLYVRVYIYFTALPPGTYDYDYYFGLFNSQNSLVAEAGIRQGAVGQYQFVLRYNFPSTTYLFWSNTPQINTWYCFELKFVKGTSGEYRLYIDGVERITASNVDTSGAGTIEKLRVGAVDTAIGEYVYVDCVVVADTYIGPETAKQWNTVATWTHQLITRQWQLSAEWNMQLITRVWRTISEWTLTLQALGWHLITAWTSTLQTLGWHTITTWTNIIITRSWQTITEWTIYLGKTWCDIVQWRIEIAYPWYYDPKMVLAVGTVIFMGILLFVKFTRR